MAKPLPDTYPGIGRRGYQRAAYVRALDWSDLIDAAHFLYRESRGRSYGWSFRAGAFVTTSSTYTTTDDNGLYDLSDRASPLIIRRELNDPGSAQVEFLAQAQLQNADARWTLQRQDETGATQIAQLTLTESAGSVSRETATTTMTLADVCELGNADNGAQILTASLEIRQNGGTQGAAYWASPLESRISSTSLFPSDLL